MFWHLLETSSVFLFFCFFWGVFFPATSSVKHQCHSLFNFFIFIFSSFRVLSLLFPWNCSAVLVIFPPCLVSFPVFIPHCLLWPFQMTWEYLPLLSFPSPPSSADALRPHLERSARSKMRTFVSILCAKNRQMSLWELTVKKKNKSRICVEVYFFFLKKPMIYLPRPSIIPFHITFVM